MHKELKFLFDEDQYECVNQPPDGTPEYATLRQKCKARISRVKQILESNADFSGADYFHACIIYMHGDCPDDFFRAYNLALKAVDQNYSGSKKFAAAAYDKYLMYQGKPQKFGTQYVPDGVGLRIWDTDPQTNDEERADWELPTLEELLRNVNEVNKKFDFSKIKIDTKPQWLKDAIRRWNSLTPLNGTS